MTSGGAGGSESTTGSANGAVAPVGQALIVLGGARTDPLHRAIAAIDRVHVDGTLPRATVEWAALFDPEAEYQSGPPHRIVVSDLAQQPAFSLIHEVGHFLDEHGLGDGKNLASATSMTTQAWRDAVQTSVAYQELRGLKRRYAGSVFGPYFNYASRFAELWARSYAQYFAVKSGDPILLAELHARRLRRTGQVYIPLQWDDTDFAALTEEIDAIFRAKGWIT